MRKAESKAESRGKEDESEEITDDEAKAAAEAAKVKQIEETHKWEDQHWNKTFRVERGYEDGEKMFGQVGICTGANKEKGVVSIITNELKNYKTVHVPLIYVMELGNTIQNPAKLLNCSNVSFEKI